MHTRPSPLDARVASSGDHPGGDAQPRSPQPAAADRAEAAHPLRQTGSPEVHEPPRLRAAFERAVRRAGIPIGFSSGFTPHPKISYANASPTGAASEAEHLEIGMTRPCDPAEVRAAARLGAAGRARHRRRHRGETGSVGRPSAGQLLGVRTARRQPEHAQSAVAAFLATDEVLIERMMKRGLRTLDCRDAVLALSARSDETRDQAHVRYWPRSYYMTHRRYDQTTFSPDSDPAAASRSSRRPSRLAWPRALWTQETGTVGDPFAFDRDAS